MNNEDRRSEEQKIPFEIIVDGHIYKLPRVFLIGIYDSYQLINAIPDITYKEKFLRLLIDNGRSEDDFVPSVEQLSKIDDAEFHKSCPPVRYTSCLL